jgi:phage gp36-like protein
MSYCTQADLTDRYGTERIAELTRDASGASVDSTLADDAIGSMTAKIDAALRVFNDPANYDNTNDLLNDLAIEGSYLLLVKWSPGGWADEEMQQWKMVQKQLDNIADDRIRLTSETEEQKEDRIEGFFSSDKRLYNRPKNSLSDMGLCSP